MDEPKPCPIAEAMTDYWGERCPDFEPDCHGCQAWSRYDALIRETREAARLREELSIWKPLTPAEAQKAYDEAEAEPWSREEVDALVARLMDPAERATNKEGAQLHVQHRKIAEENKRLREALKLVANGDYDNAHDCKAAAKIAAKALKGGA